MTKHHNINKPYNNISYNNDKVILRILASCNRVLINTRYSNTYRFWYFIDWWWYLSIEIHMNANTNHTGCFVITMKRPSKFGWHPSMVFTLFYGMSLFLQFLMKVILYQYPPQQSISTQWNESTDILINSIWIYELFHCCVVFIKL